LPSIERLAASLSAAVGVQVELTRPSDSAHGDFATNAALQLAGRQKRNPREVAAGIAEAAAGLPGVARVEIAGPGFVNLFMTPAWYAEAVAEILAAGRDYGAGSATAAGTAERIQVELVSANPTGPLTVGSARNGAFGDAVARLLRFAGNDVVEEYYFNDSGGQMDKFRLSVDARRRGEQPPEDGYVGEYIDDLAKLDGDPVPHMLTAIEQSLERFRVHIDSWQKQTVIEQEIPVALKSVDTFVEEGATWVRTTAHGDDKDRVVLRSNGEPTYFAADVAYMHHKLRDFQRAIYVLGADHHGYVARLKAIGAMIGGDADRVEVLIYQLVHLLRGGEKARMGKRSGNVVFLDDLLDEIGVDAARWYLVERGPDQTLEIDVDLASEKSRKNPVYYVQYVHARIGGLFREAGEGVAVGGEPPAVLAPEEQDLIKQLAEFPHVAAEAARRRTPQAVPQYAIRLADDFHRFYHECRVLGVEEQAWRLGVVRATQHVIARCLDLVGVEAPERM
jgi:arginyl-tRNA synthetase